MDSGYPAYESALHIRFFGPLELAWGDELLPMPSSPTARSLLAYLILRHDYPIPRDHLTGIFWPERPDVRARRALSQALWQIRSSLGPAAGRLVAERQSVAFRLHSGDWLDTEEFEKVQETGNKERLASYVQLYQADFFEECYDDWALLERERLRELYLDALEQLIALYKQKGDYGQALTYAQKLVAADALREAAHRESMQLYYLLGRSQAALDQFVTLRRLLADELRVSPTAATASLYQEIAAALDESVAPHLPVAPPPPPILRDLARLPLVGRETERNALLDALQTALQGDTSLVLIEGVAGVGKSRLVAEIAADAVWRGFRVGTGKAEQMIPMPPYGLLTQVLLDLLTPLLLAQLATLVEPRHLSAVAHLLPTIADDIPDLPRIADTPLDRQPERLWEGLARCIAGLAQATPLLILLEDLHWADAASLAALRNLFCWLEDSRLLVVVTYRAAEAWEYPPARDTLDGLDRVPSIHRIRLKALDADQTISLVQRALRIGKREAAFATRLWDESGGNPLLIVETLKALLEQGDMTLLPDGSWHLPSGDMPLPVSTSIQQLVGERLARLSSPPRTVLEWVAVLGENADFDALSHGSDVLPPDLVERMSVLVRQGFLAEREGGYRFEHGLIWENVYRSIGPQRRQELHRRAGGALETLHPERVEALALHFDRGNVPDRALSYTLQAGEQAEAVGDCEGALAHYDRALTWTDENSTVRWDTLAHRERALGILGRREAQSDVLSEMLRLAERTSDPVRQADTYHRQGWLEVLAGDAVRALELLDRAAKLARAAGEHDLLGECLTAMARAWWRIGDAISCQTAVEKARTIFRETGNRHGETGALNMLGNLHLGLTGNYAQALTCFEENARIAHAAGDQYRAAAAQANAGIACTLLGCYRRSQEALAEAYRVMTRTGDCNWQGIILHWQGVNHFNLGDLDQAQAMAQEALVVCRQVGNSNFEIEALGALGSIALEQRDWERAIFYFQQAVEVAQVNRQTMDRAVQQSHLALAYLRLDRLDEARSLAEQAITILDGLGEQVGHLKEIYFARYQIAVATEGLKAARPYLERAYRALHDMASDISDPDLRRSFLENVAENRAIVVAHRLGYVPAPARRQIVRLPRTDAPTGRLLREDEFVQVTWTLFAQEDEEISGKIARRRHRILRLLREAAAQFAAPTVTALAEALDVNARTIKRDLAALRAVGHNAQTRGSHRAQ